MFPGMADFIQGFQIKNSFTQKSRSAKPKVEGANHSEKKKILC
jgi:hypothetical protein